MSNGTASDPTAPPLADLAKSIVAQALTPGNLEKLRKNALNAGIEGTKELGELGFAIVPWAVGKVAEIILATLNAPQPIYNELGKVAVQSLLGEGGSKLARRDDAGVKLIARIAGTPSEIQPGTGAAERYLTMLLHEQTEAWVRGVMIELMTDWLPEVAGVGGSIETFAKLEDIISNMLGDGRLVRRILMPFLNATTITPAQWHVNKQYRPELLSPAAVIEATLAGRYNIELAREELARQGWSEQRIDVLIENAKKRVSFGDLVEIWLRGGVSRPDVIHRAGALGYDYATADELLTLAQAKHRDRWKDPIVDAAVAAYITRDIDEGELRRLVEANAPTHEEAQFIITAAKTRRTLRVRSLSSGEARRLALSKILSVIDYRKALEREGYEPEAVTALELELRMELDQIADAAEARKQLEEERAAEKAAREAERLAREAELAARRALPALLEYRRAYVRGIIARNVLESAIERDKPAISEDDLALLLADADADRNAYLGREEEKAAIEARRHDRTLPIARLEDSTLRGIFTLGEYDAELAKRQIPDDERRLLVAVLQDRLDERDEAEQRRREAEARAEVKRISLPDFERAVRLGLRTRDAYRDLLAQVDTPDVQVALVLDLLDRQIADDNAARARREQHERELAERRRQAEEERDARERERLRKEAQRAIPLALRRRAVVNGIRPRAYYEQSLVDAGWTADDQVTELALLDLEMAQAAADRERRRQIEEETERRRLEAEERRRLREEELERRAREREVPVAALRRGVLAGLVDIERYGRALAAAGWTLEQTAIELQLLERELGEQIAAAERRARIEQEIAERKERARLREEERERIRNLPPPPPELTLGQMERAVVLGISTPDELRAWLLDRAYDDADVELIVALAVARIPDVRQAEQTEARVERELAERGVQLTDLKRAVKRGIRTLDDYAADIASRGYGVDDVALLRQLLGEELAVDMAGLRKKVEDALAKTEGAAPLPAIVEAFNSGELDVAGVRDVLVLSGLARDASLVFARLLAAYGLEG